ncbi:monoamine oxidase [Sphingomonas naasensis]|uniref:Tryptophan 2-monooxygenase n=1 Tax=Sphingomonas naasensis TaxID=1344951 RepID=A0A4S1WRJ9_9SPHN|nr:NAD(P)/FAD-dependent oxidoreductase [Sphingomonas naasensis]NIJ20544.1 monoamine oxidase [Sphingomonas naasensis]TGX44630.1 FAD-dependent oxidoreductase [Sphingomonas naasensis]
MHETEFAVIGGGAAGVAAARTLADAGREVLIVEASNRLGGRAHTVHVAGLPIDLGAGWLHSAPKNPWVAIAEAQGFSICRTRPRWGEQWRGLGFTQAEQEAMWAAFEAFQHAMETPPPSDRASDLLPADGKWNAALDALSGYINGAPTREMSVTDWRAYDDAALNIDWRVSEGYGALVASHAAGLRVALATPVTAIDASGTKVRIETPRGAITAGAAIVTVSTNVLASGALRLPGHDAILHAAAELPLGLADKLFFALDGGEDIDANAHLLGDPRNACTGTYTLRPFGRPIVECMLGGEGARAMEKEGLDGAAAFAIGELIGLLGSDWRQRLRFVAGSAWGREDHILGGYSHALPGRAEARRILATPIDPRIRFAGEACSPGEFSTVHGAYNSGVAAAKALLAV